MPEFRGFKNEESPLPDTKIPTTVIPRKGDKKCTVLSESVNRLNRGEYNGRFHYSAIVYLQNLKRYVLLYRKSTKVWSVDNFVLLQKTLDASMNMVDTNEKLQKYIHKIHDIQPIGYTRRNKRRQNTTKKD